MRIIDWSSYVCSSDLKVLGHHPAVAVDDAAHAFVAECRRLAGERVVVSVTAAAGLAHHQRNSSTGVTPKISRPEATTKATAWPSARRAALSTGSSGSRQRSPARPIALFLLPGKAPPN